MLMIHEQRLAITDTQFIELPMGSKLLHVGEQGGYLCVWYQFALPEDDHPKVTQRVCIEIIGTGNMHTKILRTYIGTVSMTNGLVYHVFEAPSETRPGTLYPRMCSEQQLQ